MRETNRVHPEPEADRHAKRVADGTDDEGQHPALAPLDELAEEGEEEEEVELRNGARAKGRRRIV